MADKSNQQLIFVHFENATNAHTAGERLVVLNKNAKLNNIQIGILAKDQNGKNKLKWLSTGKVETGETIGGTVGLGIGVVVGGVLTGPIGWIFLILATGLGLSIGGFSAGKVNARTARKTVNRFGELLDRGYAVVVVLAEPNGAKVLTYELLKMGGKLDVL